MNRIAERLLGGGDRRRQLGVVAPSIASRDSDVLREAIRNGTEQGLAAKKYMEQFVRTAPRGQYGKDIDKLSTLLTHLR